MENVDRIGKINFITIIQNLGLYVQKKKRWIHTIFCWYCKQLFWWKFIELYNGWTKVNNYFQVVFLQQISKKKCWQFS